MEKVCSNCKNSLPLGDEHFHRNVASEDGYVGRCRVCIQLLRLVKTRNPGKALTVVYKEVEEGYKVCSNCEKELPATNAYFATDNSKPDKLCYRCKVCEQMYQLARYATCGEKVRKSNANWRKNNLEKMQRCRETWEIQNPDQCRANKRACSARRRAALLNATPLWSQTSEIKNFYFNCPKGCDVDHIIPLSNGIVCGLHVLANLQYLSEHENEIKSNKLLYDYAKGLKI
jgi:HNH endonuclease.